MIKIRNAIFTEWFFAAVGLNAQTLKIDDCYRLAIELKTYE
jgi:hypothetical protein